MSTVKSKKQGKGGASGSAGEKAVKDALSVPGAQPADANYPRAPFDPWRPIEQAVLHPWETEEEMMQGVMARGLTSDQTKIVNGSGMDVLEAISTCIKYKLIVPDWLGDCFRQRLNAVVLHEVASWDAPEAFGRPIAKGAHLARLRKDSRAGPVIYRCVRTLLEKDPSRPIDEALFDEVAAKFSKNEKGLGRSECQRIYYAVATELDLIFGPIPGRPKRSPAAKSEKSAVRRQNR